MITFVRTAVAQPGKIFDVLAVAKEIATLVTRVIGRDLAVSITVGGTVGEIVWIAHYDSLAQLDEATVKLMADAEYRAVLKKVENLIVPGTIRDHIWKQV
ncbi:MAG: hypothetical protein ACLQIQ_07985 [Beijerinckiaceae bacterium]